MLLSLLTREEKKYFIDLLNRVVLVDGKATETEQKIFNRLKYELGESFNSYKLSTLSIDKLINYFAKKNDSTKRLVYMNVVALTLNDELYSVEEHLLIEKIQEAFGISEKKKKELMKLVYAERDLRENAKRLISE
ncbi:MAG: hypothetical protein J6W25_03075 [Bacilli bacterium]|nr:hypothetical protein [Bacilli bacterium]MBO7536613.1 hypothetical protein [Bacilli bacterium]MBP5551700.1 hypothetical protein [Bacilli bacterium]